MKKFLILLLICIISLSLFACDTPPKDTDTSTDTDKNTDLPDNKDDYIKTNFATKETIAGAYYTEINDNFGNYLGYDLPYNSYRNPYYKVVKSYEGFSSMFSKGSQLDKALFDEHYILLIYKNEDYYKIGLSNLRIEDGQANIDLTGYYSSTFSLSDAEVWSIKMYLIPNTISCNEENFAKLNINKNTIITYPYSTVTPEALTLENNQALIFTTQEQLDAFKAKYNFEYYSISGFENSIYILLRDSKKANAYEGLTLDGDKLTITAHTTGQKTDDITVIEISRDELMDEIPQGVSLEIQYKAHQVFTKNEELTKEEWINAFEAQNSKNRNFTEEIHLSYKGSRGEPFDGICTCLNTENARAEISDSFQYCYDYENNCYYEAVNGKWVKHDGYLFNDSAFFFYDFSPIKEAYDFAAFVDYLGIYRIDKFGEYTDIKVKITDGEIVYISFTQPSAWQENSKDSFTIYRYNFGTTEIIMPKDGEVALMTEEARKRAEKVTINLDYHSFGDSDQVKEEELYPMDKSKRDAGYIGINQYGNEYIAYAPNTFTYYVSVTGITEKSSSEINSILSSTYYKYFNDSPEEKVIDVVYQTENMVTIYFPDFDSYFECQEYLLYSLSKNDDVKTIKVGYINTQNQYTEVNNTHEFINLYRSGDVFSDDCIFNSYSELKEALSGLSMPTDITEGTFKFNYVFGINTIYNNIKISDAKFENNTVYLTINELRENNVLEDAIDKSCSLIVIIPKYELGVIPNNVEIKTFRNTIYNRDNDIKIEPPIVTTYTVNTVSKQYYTQIRYDFGDYIGKDNTTEGEYYKVVTAYEDFLPLVEHGNFIEKSVFENYNILIIQRNYGGRYSSDIGFSNFRIENNKAYIDLYEYTGYTDYYDSNYSATGYYLISKETPCSVSDFEPITINKTKIYSYKYDCVNIEDLNLEENEALIFNNSVDYRAFAEKYGIKTIYSYSCAIIIPRLTEAVSYGYAALSGNKLTLTIDEGASPFVDENQYIVVGIPTSPYNSEGPIFEGEIPKNVELEIIINKNSQPIYSNELSSEEWITAMESIYSENATTKQSVFYYGNLGELSHATQILKETENLSNEYSVYYYHSGERIAIEKEEIYCDDLNGCHYIIENGVWVKKEGILLKDSIFASIYDIYALKDSYNEMQYDKALGIYTLDLYNYDNGLPTMYEIQVKISNGNVVYAKFYNEITTEKTTVKATYTMYFYDYGTTEITLPEENSTVTLD